MRSKLHLPRIVPISQELLDFCCEAEETFGMDELVRYAQGVRQRKEKEQFHDYE